MVEDLDLLLGEAGNDIYRINFQVVQKAAR